MSKLNQIIAVTAGKKSRSQKAITEVYHQLQKPALLDGIARTYRPKDEDGEKLPAERKHVQVKVKDAVVKVKGELADLFDVVATQDYANCVAKADVKVDGVVLLEKVPVTYLLFLEKQLVDLGTFVEKLPTLDPAESWKYSQEADAYASDPYETIKTRKALKNHIKADATKEHPAQVETYSEDVVVGYWTTVKFSGAVHSKERNDMLERVRKLQESVKVAREEANSTEVQTVKLGAKVLDFVLGK